MTKWMRAAGAFATAAALGATSACGVFGGEPEETDDETRLVDLLNEGYRLESELNEAEYRVIEQCLEAQGHTVHDQYEMQTWGNYEQKSLVEYYPYDEYLPEPDMAEKWGFGQWSNTEEGWESGEAEEYQKERWGDQEEDWEEPDNSEFEALSAQERYDWYVAYHGEEYAEQNYGWVLDEGDFEEDGGLDAEDPDAEGDAEGDGGLDFEEDMVYEEPKPGGCKLEMIEALYGEPRQIKEEGAADGGYSYWAWRPENPQEDGDWEEMQAEYRAAVVDEEYAFIDCLAENGWGNWEFDEYGSLPIWQYFEQIYQTEGGVIYEGGGAPDVEVPEAPEDLPSDFEGKKAYEIEMAVGFVECGQESGYRDAAKAAWEKVQLDFYLGLEEGLYAWQQEMKDAIKRAQEMIDS